LLTTYGLTATPTGPLPTEMVLVDSEHTRGLSMSAVSQISLLSPGYPLPPPTSAGSGGGSGVVDVGVVEVVGVADPDVVGVVGSPGAFGACEPWKSTQDSLRMVSLPELTVSELGLTV
jgi:hypothetical protein